MNAVLNQPLDQKLAEKPRWVRVAFITLTSRNLTDLNRHKGLVQSFLERLSCRTRVHLAPIVGSEDGNTHSHLVVAVPEHEQERFLRNLDRNPSWRRWNGHFQLETYDHSLGDRALFYVAKHDLWGRQPDVLCPRRSHACRKDNCPHK